MLIGFTMILLLIGCSGEKNITGEVFIVTQGGQNYKLGLVNVGLISEEKVKPHLEHKIKIANENVLPIYKSYKQMRDRYTSLDILEKELGEKKRLLEIHDKNNEMLSVINKRLLVAREQLALLNKMDPLNEIYRKYTSGDFFLNDLPKPDYSTKTDSDGKFNLVIQKGKKYFIIASATRKVGNTEEYYYWLIQYPNSSFRENEKIILSNDNLFDPLKILNFEENIKNVTNRITT